MNAGDLYSKGCNIRLRRLQYSLETTFVHVKGRPAVTARTFTVKKNHLHGASALELLSRRKRKDGPGLSGTEEPHDGRLGAPSLA